MFRQFAAFRQGRQLQKMGFRKAEPPHFWKFPRYHAGVFLAYSRLPGSLRSAPRGLEG